MTENSIDTSIYGQRKTAYCEKFALSHLSALRPIYLGGALRRPEGNPEEAWRNVAEHSLVSGIFADILAEEFGKSDEERRTVVRAALVHDWAKKRESKAIDEELERSGTLSFSRLKEIITESEKKLSSMGFTPSEIDLSSANIPRTPDGPQTDLGKIIWFVDMMLSGTQPTPILDRLTAVEKGIENGVQNDVRGRRSRALVNAYGEQLGVSSINEINRQLAPKISKELARRIKYPGDPMDLPLYLETKFKERVNR